MVVKRAAAMGWEQKNDRKSARDGIAQQVLYLSTAKAINNTSFGFLLLESTFGRTLSLEQDEIILELDPDAAMREHDDVFVNMLLKNDASMLDLLYCMPKQIANVCPHWLGTPNQVKAQVRLDDPGVNKLFTLGKLKIDLLRTVEPYQSLKTFDNPRERFIHTMLDDLTNDTRRTAKKSLRDEQT